MTDQLDQPEEDGYQLVVPFIACKSHGGRYDDDSFVAGFQAGQIDQALKSGATAGAVRVWFPMVYATLREQLELIAMNRGYPLVEFALLDGHEDWVDVTFKASVHDAEPE